MGSVASKTKTFTAPMQIITHRIGFNTLFFYTIIFVSFLYRQIDNAHDSLNLLANGGHVST